MPELPEVETIRRGLEKYVVGHTIEDVEVRLPKMVIGDIGRIRGAKIQRIRRYGKGLVIDLDNEYSLAVHVKMTGQLLYKQQTTNNKQSRQTRLSQSTTITPIQSGSTNAIRVPNKYTHVIFKLYVVSRELSVKKYAYLFYNDQRQFGWIKVVKTDAVMHLPFFKSLGPEPLKDLTIQQFSNILKAAKTPIKLLIMDQAKIAGIGNIYANDALYRAKIHPQRPANSLSQNDAGALFCAIEEVLQKGIEVGGASEWHYVDVLGGKGQYQNFFLVYRKDGEQCAVCGTKIERISLGGRGTFFCPKCQK